MGDVPLSRLTGIRSAEKVLAAVCLAACLIGAGFVFPVGGTASSGERQVTLIASGTVMSCFTGTGTVGDFLDEVGIRYSEYDSVEPPPDSRVVPGLVVSYRKALRVFVSDAGGPVKDVMCAGETVCDLLDQLGIGVRPLDRVTPPPSTPLEADLRVRVTRVDVLDVTRTREIPPPVELQPDPGLPRGCVEDVEPGLSGLAEDVTRIYYRNGRETLRQEAGTRVLREPVRRVAKVGTLPLPPLASRGGDTGREVMSMVSTAYDPSPSSCWPYADGLTATGHRAGRGVCAVDPRVIPLGTQLWVEGYGYAVACDTGGAIKGNRIDLCFNTRAEAVVWGRRNVLVYIVEQ